MCHNCEPFSPISFLGFSDGVRIDGSFFLLLFFAKIFLKVEIFFSIDPLQHRVKEARKLLPHKLVPSPLGDKRKNPHLSKAHLQGLLEICIWT